MKPQIKRIATAVVLACASLGAQAAITLPTTPPITVTGPGNLGSIVVPSIIAFGDVLTSANTTFYDDFTFTIPTAQVSAISAAIDFSTFLNISNFSSALYAGGISGSSYSTYGVNPFSTAPLVTGVTLPSNWTGTYNLLPMTGLNPGTYTLQVTGKTGNGILGKTLALYGGAVSISAVPEPSSYALLLAGLGLLGAISGRGLRRRRV